MNRRDWILLGCTVVAFFVVAVAWRLLQPYYYAYFRPSWYDLQIRNASSRDIEEVEVQYVGAERRETFGSLTPNGEASIGGVRTPVPDQMLIEWMDTEGERREATVEVGAVLDVDLSVRFKTPQIVILFEDDQEPRAALEFLPF